jgi:hypothetical protein
VTERAAASARKLSRLSYVLTPAVFVVPVLASLVASLVVSRGTTGWAVGTALAVVLCVLWLIEKLSARRAVTVVFVLGYALVMNAPDELASSVQVLTRGVPSIALAKLRPSDPEVLKIRDAIVRVDLATFRTYHIRGRVKVNYMVAPLATSTAELPRPVEVWIGCHLNSDHPAQARAHCNQELSTKPLPALRLDTSYGLTLSDAASEHDLDIGEAPRVYESVESPAHDAAIDLAGLLSALLVASAVGIGAVYQDRNGPLRLLRRRR